MNKKQYQKYLQSDHWKYLSGEVKRIAEYRCQLCNSPDKLNVHHRTYDRVGKERMSDLICLCDKCHKKFHDIAEKSNECPAAYVELKESAKNHKSYCKVKISVKIPGGISEIRRILKVRRVYGLLISYPGNDVAEIIGYDPDLPITNVETGLNPELIQRLNELVGCENVRIEEL